ncbi:hypothetical protein [Kitasatospora cheerisanensis]|uniref:HTH luxR-type domain-containing protein n=1 Tax=Kitasatospora cheerisanensis KCTC 2395 TaxID=1348663 RepID=A0A066Z6C4_9ACTN|nr:hypothetical protein [Kitasatospora cheerisanensis]KDN85680.1 hypothetical protein KCH_25890 [Kitasatospora cheerisanensis KCTC 2395]
MTAADQQDAVHLTRLRDLTAQEHKLAVLVATGIGPRGIAAAPGPYRSTEAARKAVEALLRRTGARTRPQLSGWMAAAGLISAPIDTEGVAAARSGLPPRCLTILYGWADGLTTEAVARVLGLGAAQKSMAAYLRTLFLRLGVWSPEEAVVVGVLTGLVEPAPPGEAAS